MCVCVCVGGGGGRRVGRSGEASADALTPSDC